MPKSDFASTECNQASSLCACVTLFFSSSLSSKICKLTREDVPPLGGASTYFQSVSAFYLKVILILLRPLTSLDEWEKNQTVSSIVLGQRSLWCLQADNTHSIQILLLLLLLLRKNSSGVEGHWYIPFLIYSLLPMADFTIPWQSGVTTDRGWRPAKPGTLNLWPFTACQQMLTARHTAMKNLMIGSLFLVVKTHVFYLLNQVHLNIIPLSDT